MKEPGNGKFEINLIKTLSPEQKRLAIVAPAILAIALTVIYFAVYEDSIDPEYQKGDNAADFSLPDASSKSLNNDKSIVVDEFESINEKRRKDEENEFNSVLNDPLGENGMKNEISDEETQLMTVKKQLEMLENPKRNYASNSSNTTTSPNRNGNYNRSSKNNNSSRTYNNNSKEEQEEEESDPIVVYTSNDNENSNSNSNSKGSSNKSSTTTFQAKIAGKQTITRKEPYASIMLLEDLILDNLTVPKFTQVAAVANFDESRVYFKIESILIANEVYEVDIEVLDVHGYRGIPIKGGTGAAVQGEAASEAVDDVLNSTPVGSVPGSGVVKSLFKKEPKAKLNGDRVKLKINK